MYSLIVRRKIRNIFGCLNRGDYEEVLKGVSPLITHRFSGNHAFGGTRHSVDAMRKWFQRLYILLPNLRFEIKEIVVNGFPWDTTVAVEWVDAATPADGSLYVNQGVHFIKISWGKVISLHAYLDTQLAEELCERLAVYGIADASAPPIED
jgi:ketosteroid isomerase-like protein